MKKCYILFYLYSNESKVKMATEVEGDQKAPFSIFTNPSARAGYDTRSIFKTSLTGLDLEFSFS